MTSSMTDTNELGDALELSPLSRSKLIRLRQLRLQTAEIKEVMDKIIEDVKGELNGNPLGTINGAVAVSWKGDVTNKFSQKVAKEKLDPELFQSCFVSSTVFTFRLKDFDL